MYLSKMSFFKKKAANENYYRQMQLNLLKNNLLKMLQILFLQQILHSSTANSVKAAKQKRRIFNLVRQRLRAKKRTLRRKFLNCFLKSPKRCLLWYLLLEKEEAEKAASKIRHSPSAAN